LGKEPCGTHFELAFKVCELSIAL